MLQADPHAWRLDRSPHNWPRFPTRWLTEFPTLRACERGFRDLAPERMTASFVCRSRRRIAIRWSDRSGGLPEYRPRPPRLSIDSRGLAPLERGLPGSQAAQFLGRATARDVFVAHELYHHIEAIRPDVPIARRYRPSLFRIGNWHWRTGIAALAEMRRRRLCAVVARPALSPEGTGLRCRGCHRCRPSRTLGNLRVQRHNRVRICRCARRLLDGGHQRRLVERF